MEIPPLLRQAVERAFSGVGGTDIATTAATLSQRYRQERQDGKFHIRDKRDALAYVAVRMPATYAATRASLAAVAKLRPDFAPRTMLDAGAGPGTVLWAASDCWPSLDDALMIEASPIVQAYGQRLAAELRRPHIEWRVHDINAAIESAPRDLVTLAYALNELAAGNRPVVLERLWQLTADMLLIVEPGTPAGWQRILAARRQLIEAGAHIVAPCPHASDCPLQAPDWCHFAARVARSRLHRQAKGAEVPWEDEKFSYVAVSRRPPTTPGARVIAHPRKASGRVTLKLCRPDGSAGEQLFSRRDGAAYKNASRSNWGSLLD